MANDYINPFSANEPSSFASGATPWQMFYGAKKEAESQPFLDMARQQQQLDLQKKGIETGEFASPEARNARMLGFGADAAKHQQTITLTPQETLQKMQESQDKQRSSGILTDKKMAEAEQFVNTHKVQHLNDFTAGLAGMGEALDKLPPNLPPEMRNLLTKKLYDQHVNQWQMQHPDKQLPAHLQHFDQDTPSQIAIARYTDTVARKNAAAENLKNIEGGYQVRGHEIGAAATRDAATIGAASRERSAGITAGASLTGERERTAALERNAALTAGSKEQRNAVLVEEALTHRLKGDPVLQSIPLRLMQASTDAEREQIRKESRDLVDQHRKDIESRMKTTSTGGNAFKAQLKPGEVAVRDRAGKAHAIPRAQLDEAKKQGYEEIK